MGMQLKSFRVTNFRSVDDSGVIETDEDKIADEKDDELAKERAAD